VNLAVASGADFAIRTIYHPETWPLRVTVLDANGEPKDTTTLVEQDVAGPCCIQSDVIAHQRPLPKMEPGDWVMIHDVGGYMHASYSCYNARQCPPVWGYGDAWGQVVGEDLDGVPLERPSDDHVVVVGEEDEGEQVAPFVLLQPGQQVEETLGFFSHHGQQQAMMPHF